ncbi:MAG TPA: mycothiol synthase [Acidimicrobiia bacterium]|nr:mycothiol synthase [Acidimicrobiia bacterium]
MTSPPVVAAAPEQFGAIRERVARIEESAQAVDGHPSLGEAVWRDLDAPQPDSAGFYVDDVAYAHVARSDNVSPRHWMLGVSVVPGARDGVVRRRLLDAALAHIAARGGGRAVLWLLGARPEDDAELGAVGLRPDRDLFEMRVPLPLAEQPQWPAGTEVRPFTAGRDEQAWLDVNNRAFANHAEQGGWVAETLERRMAEPWFDPALFLLAFDAKGLAGFNWMKIHDAHGRDPRLGEIFVIAVDPRMQGSGLGRALAVAGLDAVRRRGVDTGSLFCAADNTGALHLYESLGFTVHRTDRAYEREVAPG